MLQKQLCEKSFRTEWDDLGCFFLFDVPVLFPPLDAWIQAGRTSTGTQIWNENNVGGIAQVNNAFGKALAAGDFNDDGRRDLAIGIPNEPINGLKLAGRVVVIFGSSSGLSTSRHVLQIPRQGSIQAGALFGNSLSAWDFGLDLESVFPLAIYPTTDLAIGSPGYAVSGILNSGAITVFYGSHGHNGLLQPSNPQLIT